MQERFGHVIGQDAWLELDSSTDAKFSRHLILQDASCFFKSNLHVGCFVMELIKMAENEDGLEGSRSLYLLQVMTKYSAVTSVCSIVGHTGAGIYPRILIFFHAQGCWPSSELPDMPFKNAIVQLKLHICIHRKDSRSWEDRRASCCSIYDGRCAFAGLRRSKSLFH